MSAPNVKPGLGYVLGEEIKQDSGAVVSTAISDTKQRYKVLAIGLPNIETVKAFGNLPNNEASQQYIDEYPYFKVGDSVIIQKHAAEGDTPEKMYSSGYALFLASRVIAVEAD